MRIARNRGYGRIQLGELGHSSLPIRACLGRLGDSHSPNRASRSRLEGSWFHCQHCIGGFTNCLSCTWGSYFCAIYATKEDQEGVAQEEEDVIARYYFSRYGRNDLNLIRYGERSCSWDPKLRASLGEVPSPKSTVSFIAFNKIK